MEINSAIARRDYGASVPSICGDGLQQRKGSKFSPVLSSSVAMSIPGSYDPYSDVPPPLPPPRYPPVDGLVDIAEYHEYRKPDSEEGFPDDRQSFKTRDVRFGMHDSDEGYHSIGSARTLSSPQFSMHHSYRSAPDSGIDSSMLSKLNSRRAPESRSPSCWSGLSTSAFDPRPSRATPMELPKLLSLPVRPRHIASSVLDSPHRYTQTPVVSEMSPRRNPFGSAPMDYRSPTGVEPLEPDRSPIPRSGRTDSGSSPDDFAYFTPGEMRDDDVDFPMEETSRLRQLNIEDALRERERERGQKRRASSPPGDDPALPTDLFRRRDGAGMSRCSPAPRLTPVPHSSVSSVSSGGRSVGSYVSLTTASSMTSVASFGRRSPAGRSPVSPCDGPGYESPLTASMHFAAISPRSPANNNVLAQQQQHQQQQRSTGDLPNPNPPARTAVSPRKLADPLPPSTGTGSVTAKMQGFYMCECCSKKPKKFQTKEQLTAHEAEKQYGCAYCGNRFKNKNEAERHQQSLHVRRHSWSCSALKSIERAFHESTTRPGEADICGYCGEEFVRTGPSHGSGQGRYASDQDWDVRVRHLQDVHKFKECNSSKKFYRADHFRQHLKHSHAGTSGKWTNMLENACMLEEDPPVGVR